MNGTPYQHIPVYQPPTNYLPIINRPLTNHLLTTYQPPTDHLPTTYRPPTDHQPTTYQPPTDHLLTTYQPPTDHFFLRCSLFMITPEHIIASGYTDRDSGCIKFERVKYCTSECVQIYTLEECHHMIWNGTTNDEAKDVYWPKKILFVQFTRQPVTDWYISQRSVLPVIVESGVWDPVRPSRCVEDETSSDSIGNKVPERARATSDGVMKWNRTGVVSMWCSRVDGLLLLRCPSAGLIADGMD